MFRHLFALLLAVTPTVAIAQTPLDLPSGSSSASEDEEENELINFYGAAYEGDGFFWCLDRSGSMGGPKLLTLKAEVSGALGQLSTRAEFGLVRFNGTNEAWRSTPARASSSNVAAARVWLESTFAAGGTCIAPAGVETLEIANASRRRSVRVIIVGDGVPSFSCSADTVGDITAANYKGHPVDAIFIGSSADGQALLQAVANANGGTFSVVSAN